MKSKVGLGVVVAAIASVLVLALLLFVAVGAGLKSKQNDQDDCADISMAAGASYSGDLGTIRAPWVGHATYTSKFGMRVNPGNLRYGQFLMHEGVDIAETPTPTLVVSATKGTVKKVWTGTDGANVVTIDVGANTTIDYIHLASFAPGIKAGDAVWPGKAVGMEGATGNASGPHLHFQIEVGGKPVEPWGWMKQHGFAAAPAPDAVGTVLPEGAPAVTSPPKDDGKASASAQPVAASSSSSDASVDTGAHTVSLPPTTAEGQEYKSSPPTPIPADFLRLYQSAGSKFGIPWQVIAGIGMAENNHGRNKGISSANAQGPMQFLPSTWASEGMDGDGDGIKDINNPADAILGTANYLVHSGAKQGTDGIRRAILAYNHSQEYLNSVISYAKFYAGGKVAVSASSGADTAGACNVSSGGANGQQVANVPASTSYEKAAIAAAKTYLGQPYVWGGGDRNGPSSGGFDCSGFSLYVVAQATLKASGKELVLPHLSSEQKDVESLATVATYSGSGEPDLSKMRVGDVIVYNLTADQSRHPWNHVAIYIGNGQIIHAPNVGETVTAAKISDPGKGAWVARRPTTTYTGADTKPTSSPTK